MTNGIPESLSGFHGIWNPPTHTGTFTLKLGNELAMHFFPKQDFMCHIWGNYNYLPRHMLILQMSAVQSVKQHRAGARTNLLGFLLIIPITISFIEGRIPPFISPMYSPCETIEMVNHRVNKAHFTGGLYHACCHVQHRRNKRFYWSTFKESVTQLRKPCPFLQSTPKKIRLDPQ